MQKLVFKTPKLVSPAFCWQGLGWISHKKKACWKPKSQSVLYSPFYVSKMDYSVKVFCLKKGFVKLMIRLKRNTAQCAFAELLCAFKYSHWFNYSMFFKKTNVFLFCSLSSTLIRAGVAVQGPLVYIYKRPLDSYACPDQSRWESKKLKNISTCKKYSKLV